MDGNNREKSRVKFTLTGGISLILLMFIVLLFVSFASMSISAGRADLRLSDKYVQSVTGYYIGRNAAQEYLASLDEQLSAARADASDEAAYLASVQAIARETGADFTLSDSTDVDDVSADSDAASATRNSSSTNAGSSAADSSDTTVNFSGMNSSAQAPIGTLTKAFPAGDNMQLVLTVGVLSTSAGDGPRYTVLSQKTQSTTTFDYDQSLNVITR